MKTYRELAIEKLDKIMMEKWFPLSLRDKIINVIIKHDWSDTAIE